MKDVLKNAQDLQTEEKLFDVFHSVWVRNLVC